MPLRNLLGERLDRPDSVDAARGVDGKILFNDAVEAIFDAALAPASWPTALQKIADCFGDVGSVLLYGRDDGGFGYIESVALTGATTEFFNELYRGPDLRAIRAVERGAFLKHDAFTDRHVVTAEEIETHPYYVALAKMRLKYFANAPICPDWRIVAGVVIQRSVDRPPYSDDELQTLTFLGRHVEKAFRLGMRLLDAEMAQAGLGEALTRLKMGVFVIDSSCRISFQNEEGARLLGDGLSVAGDRLTFHSAAAQRQLDIAVNRRGPADDGDFGAKALMIGRVRSEQPLTIYVLPITTKSSAHGDFLTHARAIVLVNDPDNSEPPDPSLVRDLLGLTLGEARLASLVGSGIRLRDAANRLGITEMTARTVLKRVFDKTNISRQPELATLLAKLMRC